MSQDTLIALFLMGELVVPYAPMPLMQSRIEGQVGWTTQRKNPEETFVEVPMRGWYDESQSKQGQF